MLLVVQGRFLYWCGAGIVLCVPFDSLAVYLYLACLFFGVLVWCFVACLVVVLNLSSQGAVSFGFLLLCRGYQLRLCPLGCWQAFIPNHFWGDLINGMLSV